jgi:prepilin-type N-terminal cleavage/methylation domain-containing protein
MKTSPTQNRRGFTLVELMIVIAIIALLAAIATPNFLRARKRAQASRLINDLRALDHAIEQYALDTNRPGGFHPQFADLKTYLKTDSLLYSTGTDLYGTPYGPFTVDSTPHMSEQAFNGLSDVVEPILWSPYY